MDKPFNLEAIIIKWQADNLRLVPSKRYGVPYPQLPLGPERQPLLELLVSNVKDEGKPKEFFTNSTRDYIVEYVIPKGLEPSKMKGWRNGTKATLNIAIERVYATTEDHSKNEDNKEQIQEQTEKIKEQTPKTTQEYKKPLIKIHDPNKYKHTDEPPVEDILDEEMAELLDLKKK